MDARGKELFMLTDELAEIGLVSWGGQPEGAPPPRRRATFAEPDSAFVGITVVGRQRPPGVRLASAGASERDQQTVAWLQETLRRVWLEEVPIVVPRSWLKKFRVTGGVELEPVRTGTVYTGKEPILGLPFPREMQTDDPAAGNVARVVELFMLGCDTVMHRPLPARELDRPELRLAWRSEEGPIAGKGVSPGAGRRSPWRLLRGELRVEVALEAAREDCCVTGRGVYLVGGSQAKAGWRVDNRARSAFVVEVASEQVKARFWVPDPTLQGLIEPVHALVARAALGPGGYTEC